MAKIPPFIKQILPYKNVSFLLFLENNWMGVDTEFPCEQVESTEIIDSQQKS